MSSAVVGLRSQRCAFSVESIEIEDAHEQTYFEIGGLLSVMQKEKWFDPFASLDEWVENNTAMKLEQGAGVDPDLHRDGFVTLPCREREVSAPQELSGRRDRRPPRGHRRSAKHAVRLG